MSDNQTKRFHRLISEGRIIFKAAAYTQSEDGEHPEHIAFKLDFSSSDSVAVFGVWRGMSPGDSIENMLLWDFYVAAAKSVEPFAHDGILTLPMLKESPAQKCSYAELGKVLYTKMAA